MPPEPVVDLAAPALMHGRAWHVASYREALAAEQGGSRAHLAAMAAGRVPLAWTVRGGLVAKLDEAGRFRPFFGDTVVFPLAAEAVERLGRLRDRLCSGLAGLCADPLEASTLHVTLHDLSAAPPPGPPAAELAENEHRCRVAFAALRHALDAEPDARWIRMAPVRLFHCLDISVLAGYVPADEPSMRRLLAAYALFDAVRPLDYWLRPHVTLTYFRPRVPEASELALLDRRLAECEPAPPLVLDLGRLAYQRFADMNRYVTRFSVLDG